MRVIAPSSTAKEDDDTRTKYMDKRAPQESMLFVEKISIKISLAFLLITLFADAAILAEIPILREITVFALLLFIPGFAVLGLFKFRDLSFLDTILFSVALSVVSVIFVGLLVNELYFFLGLSEPLSTLPLTVAISAFVMAVFFVNYKHTLSATFTLKISSKSIPKGISPLSIILFLLPLLSAMGILYLNIFLVLLSDAIIAALCLMSAASRKLIPENRFPLLIFSISIALICQVVLTSKHVTGWDANLEYYVFRQTQMNGHWGFLDANVNQLATLLYNSMLSINLLPTIYSSLTNVSGEMVFKIFYPFVFSLVPLALYRIFETQFGKLTGLLSTLFFMFTYTAFYGPEALSLNRQIVGELLFLLSIFLFINNTMPVTKRRVLLILFGIGLALSHYALAYIYLGMVVFVFVVSKIRHRTGGVLNTLTMLLLVSTTLAWYAYTQVPGSPLISLVNAIEGTYINLTTGGTGTSSSTASAVFTAPEVFTLATWLNVLLIGAANLFLILGFLSMMLGRKTQQVSMQFKAMMTVAAFILVVTLSVPGIASILNFTRFYAITLLLISPCFVFGGRVLQELLREVWLRINRPHGIQMVSKSRNTYRVFLPIAVILGGYFLSQTGFINRVTGGSINYYNTYFDELAASNISQVKIFLYNTIIPEKDVQSAIWLSTHRAETAEVFADSLSRTHVLISFGLIPNKLLLPITNTTIPPQGSFVYLGSLNIINGVMTTYTGSFNTSEISSLLSQCNLVYSNSNSEIWYVTSTP